jgi:hypothetical protein
MAAFAALQQSYAALIHREGLSANTVVRKLIHVSIAGQTLSYYNRGTLAAQYPVSTAANGPGCRNGSGCTPIGWHAVKSRIGDRQPVATIFRGREVSGIAQTLCDDSSDDLITSRILWLAGLETGVNLGADVDSYTRYIYIHGTAQEHLIGQPVSHGCVRLRNRDVIELFDHVPEHTPVYLGELQSL